MLEKSLEELEFEETGVTRKERWKVMWASIVVATVLPPIPNVIGGDARKEAEEAVKTDASLITQPVMDVIAKDNIACREKIVLHTSTAEGIIETAEDMKCDLIVMGSRGRSDIEGLFLGSVTHKVLTLATVPVLVVR